MRKWMSFLMLVFVIFVGLTYYEEHQEIIQKVAVSGKIQKPKTNNSTAQQKKSDDTIKSKTKEDTQDTQDTQEIQETIPISKEGMEYNPVGNIGCYGYSTLSDDEKVLYGEIFDTIWKHEQSQNISTTVPETLEKVYAAFMADHGDVFWVQGYTYTQYTLGEQVQSMEFSPKYNMDVEERNLLMEQVKASADELLLGIDVAASDYEKAKYVFETLIQNVDYDASIDNNQNILSVFLSRATVCRGYACATQYLLNRLGMESAICTGYANGQSHAWNLVKLEGEYYYMDTTWGNSRYLNRQEETEKYINYSYLCVTTEELQKTHQPDNALTLPSCVATGQNYFVKEGRYFEEMTVREVGELIQRDWENGLCECSMKFRTVEQLEAAIVYFIKEQKIADYCAGIESIYYVEDKEQNVLALHFSGNR